MRIFISYSRKDNRICEQLQMHLKPLVDDTGLRLFVDTGIELARPWRMEIDEALATADVALLLVSAPFLASEFVKTIELPAIRDAAERGGLRIIPIYVGFADLSAFEFAQYQGANMPDRPLAAMRSAGRDAIFADLVSKLRSFSGALPEQTDAEEVVPPDAIPSSGRLFDRVDDRAALTRFLKQPTRRVCILHGFPGIGKSVLVARIAEQQSKVFRRVCWIRCRERDNSADDIFARLDAFLQTEGDRSLRAPRMIRDEAKRLERLVEVTVQVLSRHPYLVVFDDFGSRLNPAHQVRDTVLSRLLREFAMAGKATKMILITDRRPRDGENDAPLPVGTLTERELVGLPADAVAQLMKECGITGVSATVAAEVTARLSGNPTAISLLCSLAIRLRLEPLMFLGQSNDRGTPFRHLLERSMADLDDSSRSVLLSMSLLRLPISWDRLGTFGLERDAVLLLLDHSLLVIDPVSHALIVPELVRQFVRHDIGPDSAWLNHAKLASSYADLIARHARDTLEGAKLRLEAGHHHLQAGERDQAADQILPAVASLTGWGYASLAEQALNSILSDTPSAAVLTEALYEQGRIADQRGHFIDALKAFERALSGTITDRLRAGCLFYIGRIRSAQGQLDAAQSALESSIALARGSDGALPAAAAMLALAWVDKERGVSRADSLRAFAQVLDEAVREGDVISASDAHRQLGFLGWLHNRQRREARQHYAQALHLARKGHAAPQIAATFNELGYLATDWEQPDRAIQYCSRAIAMSQDLADDLLMAAAHINMGLAHWKRGDKALARARFTKAAALSRQSGNPGGEAYARHELARLIADSGDFIAARVELENAADLYRKHGLLGELPNIEATFREWITSSE